MLIRRHKISDEIFFAIASGGGGFSAVDHLATVEYSKHLLLLRGILEISRESRHPQYDHASRAYDLLARIQDRQPSAVSTVIRHPAVGAWARRTVIALQGGEMRPGAQPAGLASVAAAAAIRSHFPCSIDVPVVSGAVMLPSLGQVTVSNPGSRSGPCVIRSSRRAAELSGAGRRVLIPGDFRLEAPGWRGLREITAQSGGKTIRLLIDDLDPYRMPAPSLGKRLTEQEVRTWQAALVQAWDVLIRHHRRTACEILASIKVLTPLEAPATGQVSTSARETFGCIALSSPADPLALAVTFAHEVQHAKLSALLDAAELTYPDDGNRYYAPWRDDPRPVSGRLQGAYAYLGVAAFWCQQRHEEQGVAALRAHAEFARWRTAVTRVTETLLGSGRLTRRGEAFVTGMARVARSWRDEPVPRQAEATARREEKRHAERWHLNNDHDPAEDLPCAP
jgi:HEXXH motif-containing protein